MSQNLQGGAEGLHQITHDHRKGSLGVHAPPDRSQWQLTGEYALVEAVLCAAIREYQKFAGLHSRHGERLFREVDHWFWADDRQWYFSFVNICEILNLDPTYIRTGLKMWRERFGQYPASARQIPAVDLSALASGHGVLRRRSYSH